MTSVAETLDHRLTGRIALPKHAGVVLVFSGSTPILVPMPVDGPLRIGRAAERGLSFDDARMSREHCEVRHEDGEWRVRDLNSRNGTFVDGHACVDARASSAPPVLRMGQTIALAVEDVVPFLPLDGLSAEGGKRIAGPGLRACFKDIEAIARGADNLLVLGETGSGKELAAAHFHASARPKGPFISVNCAAIPEGVAERLLFGAKKGAYSGAATDVEGYVQAADAGVLFLDELGELDLDVQAKLLRLLETKEVLALGSSTTRRVDVRFCLATHRDLRGAVAAGKFRADLLYRIAQSEVSLTPLRERREEIPWLAAMELARAAPQPTLSAELVEALMLRAWPGNVRELLGGVRRAARNAANEGTPAVRPDHLHADAGRALTTEPTSGPDAATRPTSDRPPREHPVSREELETALREEPSATAAARRLGIHRSHLYRLMKQFGISED